MSYDTKSLLDLQLLAAKGCDFMPLSSKSLEELELLADHLREQISFNPEHTELEVYELEDVGYWIEVRRKEREAGVPAAA